MEVNDLVSIITPTYNSEKYIAETIESVIGQTYQNWELIVTDDCSKDKTYTLLKKYEAEDNRIKIYRLFENSGAAVARNNSIKKSRGYYIAFLDSDDTWHPNKLEFQLYELSKRPDNPLHYTAYDILSQERKIDTQNVPEILRYKDILKTCPIGCSTVIINKKVTGDISMPLIRRRQDFALWLNILRKYGPAYGSNKAFTKYRVVSKSISSNKFKVIKYQWFTYYRIEKLGLIKSIYYTINWAVRGALKYRKRL